MEEGVAGNEMGLLGAAPRIADGVRELLLDGGDIGRCDELARLGARGVS